MATKGDLLLVDSSLIIQINNKNLLERNGYAVRLAMNLSEARAMFKERTPDVLVLDIHLPDGSGFDYLREIRKTSKVPVLMLTAVSTPGIAAACLDIGGDDYLSKPYDFKEFRARVDALMRKNAFVPEKVAKGLLELRLTSLQGFVAGKDMRLTQKEFLLLLLLVRHEGEILSLKYIYKKIWELPISPDASAIKNIVYKLRKKLSGSGYEITNERNEGYCLQESSNQEI